MVRIRPRTNPVLKQNHEPEQSPPEKPLWNRLKVDPSRRQPRTVLVLGGGGMRGMAHVGVVKAMRRLGIAFDAVVGTSIGSLVGAMAAGGYSNERMEEIVFRLQKDDYFRLNFLKFLMKGVRASSVYRGDLFRDRLEEILPGLRIGEMEVPFFCNAVRLETGGLVFWGTPGNTDISLVDAVYSSCCLPGIFEPYQREGYHYMDGGIVDALPLRFARLLRPDLIIAVDLTVKATSKHPNYKDRVLSTLYRSFEIAEEVITEQSLHMHADERTVLVQPKVGHLSRFDFENVPEVVRLGEEAMTRVLVSHAATRNLVREDLFEGDSCPVTPRDYVSLRIDSHRCIGCGNCQMVCETGAFWGRGDLAEVRKRHNYECTRDHACARNCPVGAIFLGNL
jgi:NTE family protein